jgi:uncharacterized membrane protein
VGEKADTNMAPHPRAGRRVLFAFVLGAVVFGLAILKMPWQVAIIVSWIASATLYLAWVWHNVGRADAERTASLATIEDPSRFYAELLIVAASGASIVGVALALVQSNSAGSGLAKDLIVAVAGVCLVLSWTTVNTVFMLRYARLYYGDEPGGIRFGEKDQRPAYADFAYLAFTIGMTYQVSDTTLASREIRSTALRHALLSFVFVTSVVAMTINIVAQLFTGP